MTELSEVSERLKEMDLKGALREAFGKCPKCGTKAVGGDWLKWCPKRTCGWQAPR